MKAKEYLKESDNREFVEKYIPWVAEQLGITELPKIELLDKPNDTTFGKYENGTKSLSVVIANRNPIDVLRTLAHELTHHKQNLEGKLTPGAGETGTPQENEANANAGIIMRDFAKANPEYFGVKSSSLDEATMQTNSEKKLVIFDIDDTLVTTNTRVGVVKNGRTIKTLDSHEFTLYKKQPGEEFDFGAFRDARDFFEHAQPIAPMIQQLKDDIQTGNKVVMVTARADFNSKEIFLKTFEQWHIDMSRVHVYRAGNDTDPVPIDEKKARIIRRLLNGYTYSKAIMYDDSKPNLESFLKLHQEYPDVRFYAWHVDRSGHASEFARAVDEDAITEIESIPAQVFSGGKRSLEDLDPVNPRTLKPLPGGSGLAYSILTKGHSTHILLVDPEKSMTQPIAFLELEQDNLPIPGKPLRVEIITVDEDYRGQGLAKAMYGIVLTILKRPLVSGESQTPGGRRNWVSLASIPGVEVKGVINVNNKYLAVSTKLVDQIMQLGGQFVGKNQFVSYWAFDVVPGNGQLAPAVKNSLSKIYGYDSDVRLVATWHG